MIRRWAMLGGLALAVAWLWAVPRGDAASPVAVCGLSGTAGQSNCLIPNADGSITIGGSGGAGLALETTLQDVLSAIEGSVPAGSNVIGVVNVSPTSTSTYGIVPVVSTAAESNHVISAAAANLYGFSVTTGAVAGLVMIFNATSAPGDGAVTPIKCYSVGANQTVSAAFQPFPARFSTGITIVFSSGTDCFTKAASATAFISAEKS